MRLLESSKDETPKFSFSLFGLFFPYLKRHLRKGIFTFLLMLLLSLLALPTPYLMKYIFDDVIPKKDIKLLNFKSLQFLGFRFLKLFFPFLQTISSLPSIRKSLQK